MLDKISCSEQNCEIFLHCLANVVHLSMKDEGSMSCRKYFYTDGGKAALFALVTNQHKSALWSLKSKMSDNCVKAASYCTVTGFYFCYQSLIQYLGLLMNILSLSSLLV